MSKFKEDFEEWYYNYSKDRKVRFSFVFDRLPIEMQFGVYQLFADSVGVELRIRVNHLNGMYVGIINQGITEAKKTRVEIMNLLILDFKNQYNIQ